MRFSLCNTKRPSLFLQLGPLVGSGTYGQVFEAEVEVIGRAAVKLLNEVMLKEEDNLEQSYADFLMEVSLSGPSQHA